MAQQKEQNNRGQIGGVSLSSFLQMLEQESKSCTLSVSSGDKQGCFYFDNGMLIDAQYGDEIGQDAAYKILWWDNPVFSVMPPEDRMRRIHLPLAHILLDSAKQSDEREEGAGQETGAKDDFEFNVEDFEELENLDASTRKMIQSISQIYGIKHYFLLNRQGKIITQSSRQMKFGDFIAYCIVSGIQMRKVLDVKGPSRIQLMLDSGETLMIMPGAGTILGLMLDELASVNEVSDKISKILFNR